MKDYIFNRKVARVIMQLSDELNITPVKALILFYMTNTCEMMHNPQMGIHIMSDTYIVNDVITELRNGMSNY